MFSVTLTLSSANLSYRNSSIIHNNVAKVSLVIRLGSASVLQNKTFISMTRTMHEVVESGDGYSQDICLPAKIQTSKDVNKLVAM